MLQEERLYQITNYLKEKQQARFVEIAEYLNISQATAKRDLAELEKRNQLKIVRGGAVWGKNTIARGKYNARKIINQKEKKELVKQLGDILENGYAISINAGTTSVEAAKYIADNYSEMTVITNSPQITETMKEKKDFNLIISGGIYDKDEDLLSGKQAIKNITAYNTDIAIINVGGISLEKGITDFRQSTADVINAMRENAKKTIVIADNTKFDNIECMNVCTLADIGLIITDSEIDSRVIKKYSSKGIEIMSKK